MTSILFIMEDWPITPDAAGGTPALIYSHMELLARTDYALDLVILTRSVHEEYFRAAYIDVQPDVWQRVQSWCRSVQFVPLDTRKRESAPLKHLINAIRDPLYLQLRFSSDTIQTLRLLIAEKQPTLIWAEHYLPALLASQLPLSVPLIYSHQDWNWRIKGYRRPQQGFRASLRSRLNRRAEHTLIRRTSAVVSGSIAELREIKTLGIEKTAYLPATYTPVDLDQEYKVSRARIVHLGGMNTTANRLGLQRFMQITWPLLCEQLGFLPELWIIGSTEGAPDNLLAQLQAAGAVMPGFVHNLSTILRPFDIHIIPWEHATGTRTRIPLLLNYGQVLVAHSEGVSCAPELENAKNSVIVPDLIKMASAIRALLDDEPRRREIGLAARDTFLRHFTRSALQPRLNDFLASLR